MFPINAPIHVIGVGSTGSHVCYHLGKRYKRHPAPVHVYDLDCVEEKNRESSTYTSAHVGRRKVEAISSQMTDWGGVVAETHHGRIGSSNALSGFVITALDTMADREMLWRTSIKGKESKVLWLIDVRIDTVSALVQTVNVRNEEDRDVYERVCLYSDAEAETARSCGDAMTIGPMPDLAANLAYWQLMYAAAAEAGHAVNLAFRLEVKMRPKIEMKSFSSARDIYL